MLLNQALSDDDEELRNEDAAHQEEKESEEISKDRTEEVFQLHFFCSIFVDN